MAASEKPNWERYIFADGSSGCRGAFLRLREIGIGFLVDCFDFGADRDSDCLYLAVYVEASPEDVVVAATGGAFCLIRRTGCAAMG